VSAVAAGSAEAFLDRFAEAVDAVAVARVPAAGTARWDAAEAGTSIAIPASSKARRTPFIRGIGTSARSQAERTVAASTLPLVLPSRSSSCSAG